MDHTFAIIVAGGSGTRMKASIPKQFLTLGTCTILEHSIRAFQQAGVQQIIIVLPLESLEFYETLDFVGKESIKTVIGGKERFHSVKNALETIIAKDGLVAIHDAVRPLVSPETIKNAYQQAAEHGSAVVAVPAKDSIRQITEGMSRALERSTIWQVQTPQTFRLKDIAAAYSVAYQNTFTDCASVYEAAGHQVTLLEGQYSNIKITTPEDMVVAGALLNH